MPALRRFELDDLLIRPGSYFNPDRGPRGGRRHAAVDTDIFEDEGGAGATGSCSPTTCPSTSRRATSSSSASRSATTAAPTGAVPADEDDEDVEEDELEPDEDVDEL